MRPCKSVAEPPATPTAQWGKINVQILSLGAEQVWTKMDAPILKQDVAL